MTGQRALSVVTTDGRGRRLPADGVGPWLERIAPRAARGEVALALVGDRKMRALNQRYRGVDRATDVLAFPAAGPAAGTAYDADAGAADAAAPRPPRGAPRLLGDVVIATGVARRQARAAGHALETELRRLALHGLLHLLGYDHTRDDGRMERLERKLRRKGGVP